MRFLVSEVPLYSTLELADPKSRPALRLGAVEPETDVDGVAAGSVSDGNADAVEDAAGKGGVLRVNLQRARKMML